MSHPFALRATRPFAVLVFVFAAASCVAGEAEPPAGELIFYPYMTSDGMLARRAFRDRHGKTTKIIHYGIKFSGIDGAVIDLRGPYTEDMLAVSHIVLCEYDARGRNSLEKHYAPDMKLNRARQTLYNDDDSIAARVWRDAEGRKSYETRFENGRCTCHLYYDESGEKLVGARGAMPRGMDLAYGWGKRIDGLSCGMAPNRTTGALREFVVHVSVRNNSSATAKVVSAIQYRVIKLELRDGRGAIVEQDAEYIRGRTSALLRMNRGGNESLQMVNPGKVGHWTSYRLTEWYSDLATGRYELTVRRRGAGQSFSLVSNTVAITIKRATDKDETEQHQSSGDRQRGADQQ